MSDRAAWLRVLAILGIAALGWIAAPHNPYQTAIIAPAQPPGALLLGSDTLGRDLLSRVLYGGPPTLFAGALSTAIALAVGGIVGISGATGLRGVRALMLLLSNSMLALPSFVIALVIVTGLGANLTATSVAAGLAQAGVAAQVWRGVVDGILREPYADGAAALGAGRWHIVRVHVVPNALPVILTYASTLFASSVLMISALSFLGLGGEPASPDWGNMMAEGRRAIRYAPWIMLWPAAALIAVTSALNSAARLFSRR